MSNRADKIYEILKEAGGRLKVSDIHSLLTKLEDIDPKTLHYATISSTVRQDTIVRTRQGLAKRFNFYEKGKNEAEDYSYISIDIYDVQSSLRVSKLIEAANFEVKKNLKLAIEHLSWKEFESSFLAQILEGLGFTSIEITRPIKDGGKDALCKYKRGLVYSNAIVSAKHWKDKVKADEVQRLRGIKGIADTGIIVTSSKFTPSAEREAEPSPNSRAIVLIDGDLIVETCFEKGIGVKMVELPPLYEFDPTSISSDSGG